MANTTARTQLEHLWYEEGLVDLAYADALAYKLIYHYTPEFLQTFTPDTVSLLADEMRDWNPRATLHDLGFAWVLAVKLLCCNGSIKVDDCDYEQLEAIENKACEDLLLLYRNRNKTLTVNELAEALNSLRLPTDSLLSSEGNTGVFYIDENGNKHPITSTIHVPRQSTVLLSSDI